MFACCSVDACSQREDGEATAILEECIFIYIFSDTKMGISHMEIRPNITIIIM